MPHTETKSGGRHPGGRPTKYRKAFCQEVESFMADGHSLTAFCAHVGVDRSTLDDWRARHPEFLLSVARAKGLQLLKWEQLALSAAAQKGPGHGGGASIVTFFLRNLGGGEYASDKRAKIDLPRVDGHKAAVTAISEAIKAFSEGQIDRENAEAVVGMCSRYLSANDLAKTLARLVDVEADLDKAEGELRETKARLAEAEGHQQ